MAEPTIKRGSDHFFTTIYEGNGGGQRVGNFVPFTDNGTIAKSLLSNIGDNPKLTYDISGETATSSDKWTFSAWVKRIGLGTTQYIAGTITDGNNESKLGFDDSNRAYWVNISGATVTALMISNRTFEDTSKWYHIVWSMDSTQSTASNRQRFYVDGDEITSWSTSTYIGQDTDYIWTTADTQRVNWSDSEDFDGYLAELNNVDGQQLGPDTFGLTDTSTGRWIPKSLGSITYGNTGYRLTFANNAGQTIGDDTSGNGHDFTVSNFATTDVVTDSPTQNHTTLNSIDIGPNITLSEAGLKATYSGGSQSYGVASRTPVKGGKYYCECTVNTRGSQLMFVNVWNETEFLANHGNDNPVFKNGGIGYRDDTGDIDCTVRGGINIDYGATYTSGDVIGIALDADTGTVWYSKNGTWQNNASSAQIANGLTANSAVTGLISAPPSVNQNNRFLFGVTAHSGHISTWNFGQKAFSYTPPTGYNAVQQDNFPETSKDLPDFVWSKSRDNTESHSMYDSSRGVLKQISSNNTAAENTQTDGLQKFLKGGYQCEDHERINQSGISYASWKWHANGGTTSANTDGSGATIASTIQANQDAGFSIVKTVGTGNAGTIAHGLGKAPEWIIGKNLDTSANWVCYHKSLGADKVIYLNLTAVAASSSDYWGTTEPTSNVFGVKGGGVDLNTNTNNTIFYCWTSIAGYSKFGVYTGNGNANGRYVYTGFKPAWIMFKETGNSNNWPIWDNKRFPLNPTNNSLFADLNQADNGSSIDLDVLSNGFKCRTNNSQINRSGGTYIYIAFAEHPFVGNGTNPVTAR